LATGSRLLAVRRLGIHSSEIARCRFGPHRYFVRPRARSCLFICVCNFQGTLGGLPWRRSCRAVLDGGVLHVGRPDIRAIVLKVWQGLESVSKGHDLGDTLAAESTIYAHGGRKGGTRRRGGFWSERSTRCANNCLHVAPCFGGLVWRASTGDAAGSWNRVFVRAPWTSLVAPPARGSAGRRPKRFCASPSTTEL
jgi:hypothetical protein